MADLENKTEIDDTKEYGRKKHSMFIPLILVFIFVAVMVGYTSKLIYNVAVLNSSAVIEDRIKNVSSLIENHLNTAENVLQITADSVHHMLISGSTPSRIHEFLVEETDNVTEQFGENYHGLYGYIMSKYMDGLNWVPPDDYDPKTRDWYVGARDGDGEVVFVPPYIDAQTGSLIISVCRMLPDRQNILSLDVKLDGIQSLMKELTINGKGYGFVIDESGLIIAHGDERKKGTSITQIPGGTELLSSIKNWETGSFSQMYEGEKSTVFVNRIKNNWYVVMVVSNNELYAEVTRQLIINVFICSLIFIMIAIFYYVGHKNERNYTKRMEEMKLEEQKASYERKVLELEKDAANASNKAKSDFLANMSHEIRTPMNAILGMDEMILRSSPGDPIKKYALNIQSAGKTLLSIINGILDFSKIESGKMDLVPVEYSFASVINDIVNMTMKKAQDKNLKYNIKVDEDIPAALCGDEIRVRQVMLNLINNAIKYTHEGSVSIDVSYDRSVSMLQLIVSDTGIGIKDEDMDKLFTSFQRLEQDRNRNIEGTGLGLHIAMRLVEMMEGSIEVKSKYGEGTTFTARMKQTIVDERPIGDFAQNISRMQENVDEYKPALVAPSARVLIVDDNEMNLEVIESLLKDTRIQITTAQSGQECLSILERNSFEIILLDQMMPGMSGNKTIEIMRQEHLAEGTPVIALTADAIIGAREFYLQAGFTDYLSKPVMYADLENILLKYIDPSLILTPEQLKAQEETDDKNKPVILVINDSPDKLKALKESIGGKYKGVFVRNEESAAKYMEKHEVEFILTAADPDTPVE
ncbi:MAG: response regulator [Lachnospiraceae bacterium]|nr:response regulator [Lachnospiraceae bacterium]